MKHARTARKTRSSRKAGSPIPWIVLAAFGGLAGLLLRSSKVALGGKVVLITGASRGLGLVLAREFVARGARVAICARDEGELFRAQRGFADYCDDFMVLRCDVGHREQVEDVVRAVQRDWGGIDILVNNAGTITAGPIESLSVEDFEKAMRTNFWGAVYASLAVVPQMKRRGFGRIVNVSSIGGKLAVPHLLPYTASKFALSGFSHGLRAELLKDGIRVTTVYPGLMRTGSARHAEFRGKHHLEHTWFVLADSLPVTSISAKRAARKIVRATIAGRGEIVLGLGARMLLAANNIAPSVVNEIMAASNRWLLPASPESETGVKKGFESDTAWTRSPLTLLTRLAERANNQL